MGKPALVMLRLPLMGWGSEMSARKYPALYTWGTAPIGWWLWGPFRRKLAHIWRGSDQKVHGFTFVDPDAEPQPCGPWDTEDQAMSAITGVVVPKKKEH